MSENLTKMVQKIDFSTVGDDEDMKTSPNDESSAETKELATFQPSLWPLDSVRNKLKYLSNPLHSNLLLLKYLLP